MKKRTLYIHIGTYKTGTTTIQKAIRDNRNLRRENISDIGRPPYFREICIAEKIEGKIISKAKKEISKRVRRELFFGNNKFIISAEHFSGNPNNGFKNSGVVAEILNEITKPLEVNVKIIVYLRRQDEFIQSMYTQEIHHGGSMLFEQYLSQFDENSFNWHTLIENYANKFGEDNLIVRRYGKNYMPDRNSVVRSFGDIIGSEVLNRYSKTAVANRGYSRDALEIARRCNPFLEPDEKKALRKLLQSVSSKQPFEKYDYFDVEDKLEFLKKYEESNNEVAKRYFNKAFLFEKPLHNIESKVYEGLDVDSLIGVILKIINEKSESKKSENISGINPNIDQLSDKFSSAFPFLKENLKILFGKYY